MRRIDSSAAKHLYAAGLQPLLSFLCWQAHAQRHLVAKHKNEALRLEAIAPCVHVGEGVGTGPCKQTAGPC